MAIFFILCLLYFLILPLTYLQLLKWKLRIWRSMRRFIRTRVAVYTLHNAIDCSFGIDIKTIIYVLQSDIDKQYAIYTFDRLYNFSFTDTLRDELTNDDFNKVLILLNK